MCKKIWLILFAARGPGLATVKYLLSRGQQVILLMDMQPGAGLFEANNPNLELLMVDFSSEAAMQQAARTILCRYECIDMLVNMYTPCKDEDHTKVQPDEKAVLLMIRNMLCLLRKSAYNHLIDYSSGLPEQATGFSFEMLYHEAKRSGTKVTII